MLQSLPTPLRRAFSWPTRRVGAVVTEDDHVLAWLLKDNRAHGWSMPLYNVPLGRDRKHTLAKQLSEELGLLGVRVERRIARQRSAHDNTDWYLVSIAGGRWQHPLKRPKRLERVDWVKRSLVQRYGPPEHGQRQVLDQFERLVHDCARPEIACKRTLIGGLETQYWELGDPQNPPLVLVHGLGSNCQVFRWNVDAWAKNFRVFALDLPGHGDTEKRPELRLSMSHMAHFLGDFLDHLGVEKTHLLGYSMGGYVSTLFTALKPERVDKLVLLAPAGNAEGPRLSRDSNRLARTLRSPLYPMVRGLVFKRRFQQFYTRYVPEIDVLFQETMDQSKRVDFPLGLAAVADCVESIARQSLRQHYPNINNRCLILFGEQDRIVSARHGHAMARVMPHAHCRILPRCGHMLVVEARDQVNQQVLEFLLDRQTVSTPTSN